MMYFVACTANIIMYEECRLLGCSAVLLQPPAQAGSSLENFSTLKMEGIRSSETSVDTRSTRRHIPEDGILHSHRCENLKSYIVMHICIPLKLLLFYSNKISQNNPLTCKERLYQLDEFIACSIISSCLMIP
jgi:hypothetical protein